MDRPEAAARWIAEAVETGNPLAALPPDIAPVDVAEGEATAFAVLDQLGIAPCGLRLLLRPGASPLAGPMLEGRLVPSGTPIASGALRHPRVSAAVIGVLAEPLLEDGRGPPVLAGQHPALDVSATRFGEDVVEDALLAADLARLGLLVAGKRKSLPPQTVLAALVPPESRKRGVPADIAACFAEAATAARRLGGLPAGALLVVAGLTPSVPAEGVWQARLGALGRALASFG
jgi:hypothetical protein